jgi:RNA polymerase sigma-70 factor (ECF subfamily)
MEEQTTGHGWKTAADRAMARYAGGDDAAFGELYELAGPRLCAFLARRTRGDQARAEDLLQQTFLQIHMARARFVPGAAVMPWAFAIARRLLIDNQRVAHREVAVDPQVDEEVAPSSRRGPAPDAECESRELARLFERALELVPDPQRGAFALTKWDGLSVGEAARALGTTPTAVKLRVHRTLKVLRSVVASAAPPRCAGGTRVRQVCRPIPRCARACGLVDREALAH